MKFCAESIYFNLNHQIYMKNYKYMYTTFLAWRRNGFNGNGWAVVLWPHLSDGLHNTAILILVLRVCVPNLKTCIYIYRYSRCAIHFNTLIKVRIITKFYVLMMTICVYLSHVCKIFILWLILNVQLS